MDKPNPPCKGCKDRYLGCHSKCKKYIEFRKKKDEWNELVIENKKKDKI